MKKLSVIMCLLLVGVCCSELNAKRIKVDVQIAMGVPLTPIGWGFGSGATDCADIPAICMHFASANNTSSEADIDLEKKQIEIYLGDRSDDFAKFIVGDKFNLQNKFYIGSDILKLSTGKEINNLFVQKGLYDFRTENGKIILTLPISELTSYDEFFEGGYEHLKNK